MKQDAGDEGRSSGALRGGRAANSTTPTDAGTVRQTPRSTALDEGPLASFATVEGALPSIAQSIPTGLTSTAEEGSPTSDTPPADGLQYHSSPRQVSPRDFHEDERNDGAEGAQPGVQPVKVVRRRGVCKFFNAQKGFGFVLDDYAGELGGVEVFVHYTAIASVKGGPNGFKSLAEGETVEYSIAPGPKGWQAQDVTGPSGGPCVGCPPHSGGPPLPSQAKLVDPQRKSVRPATSVRRSSLRVSPGRVGERRHSRSSAESAGRKSDHSPGSAASLAPIDGSRNRLHDPYRPVLIQAYAYTAPPPHSPTHYTATGVPGSVPDGANYEPYPYGPYGEIRPSQASAPNLAFYPPAGPIYPHGIPHPSIHVHTPAYSHYPAGPFVPASPIYHSFPTPPSPYDLYQTGLPFSGPAVEPIYPISNRSPTSTESS